MVRRFVPLLLLLLWPAPPMMAAAEVADFGRYHALVIGINDYQYLPRLETAVNDASALADLLRQRYGFEVTLLLNPTRRAVIRALDKLRGELTHRDNLLIYYAGHGVLDAEADTGFWQPVDAEEGTQAEWIPVATVTGTVKVMSAKHVMVVSDSCYSGTLTRGVSVAVRTGAERATELAPLSRLRSRTALVSGGLEPVYDGGGDGHSVFTRALLTALRENREVLDGHALFTAVRRPVVVNADQTPRYSDIRLAGHEGGDFLFVPVGLTVTPTATGDPETASEGRAANLEVVFWETIRDSARAADFDAYLAQFPDGAFAALARNRLAEIDAAEGTSEPADESATAVQTAAVSTPRRVGRFDGEWRGKATLGQGQCTRLSPLQWQVRIVDGNAVVRAKKGNRSVILAGAIDGRGRLRLASADERLSAVGLYSGGEITGRLVGRGALATCTWSFALKHPDR